MHLRTRHHPVAPIGCAAILTLMALTPSRAPGQEGRADAPRAAAAGQPEAGLVLVFPTGDRATGSLLVEVAGPSQVPVGRSYDYRVKVTNITRGLTLEDVTIYQTKAKGFSIEKSDPEFKEGDGGSARWDLSRLAPGDSRTITVTAQADEEGEAAGCLRAEYKAALCLTTRFVKPTVKVSKRAPEEIDVCDVLTYQYTVQNTGSGAARGLKLRDELPDGLTGEDGRKALEFDVGDLEPGRSREFTAKLVAAKTGDYASRAVAEGANDLKARSNRPSTSVRQAKLTVNITGPDSMYVNQPMTYKVEVKNEGGAVARASRLQVEADRSTKLIRTSKADPGGSAPQVSGNTLTWDLGSVAPGQTIAVSMTVVGRDEAELRHTATATSACQRSGDVAKAATATTTAETHVMTFPALLLTLIDRTDPVRVGDTEVYRVSVLNQGSGADKDVKVTCTLPDEFRFVDVAGTSEGQSDGRTVTLGPVRRLAPQERATWDLRVKADKPGDVRMKVELTSDYLSEGRPAVSIEPTRIIGSATQDPDEGPDRGKAGEAASKGGDPSASSAKRERSNGAASNSGTVNPGGAPGKEKGASGPTSEGDGKGAGPAKKGEGKGSSSGNGSAPDGSTENTDGGKSS